MSLDVYLIDDSSDESSSYPAIFIREDGMTKEMIGNQ